MSDPGDPRGTDNASAEEPFLERWSRRKQQAREGIDDEAVSAGPAAEEAAPPAAGLPEETPALPELPDLDSLGEDSDYSAFMAPGVDPSLRRQALRKLFSSPKFNVTDGMDDYCGDWRSWNKLGDIVTADMKYHLERAAKLAEQLAESAGSGQPEPQVPADAAAVAAAQPEPALPDPQEEPADDPERKA